MYRLLFIVLLLSFTTIGKKEAPKAWIRINQLGYTPNGVKVAVWGSKDKVMVGPEHAPKDWHLIEVKTNKIVSSGKAGKAFGEYGPFKQTYRLNFSSFKKPGRYYLQAGGAKSPEFEIGEDVYKGAADFCLRYMRQQRSGFNPFLKDSCHTQDGYVLYGEKAGIKDSTRIDVVGGWHDASDYLQYSATSANATYHLLMSYRDFPQVFADEKLANGLDGKNGMADVLDEAKWGLDWLLKMHPKDDWMFNQIADDRDHMGMRIPKMDSFYGRGYERPVYFVSGEPQQRGRLMNNTTGTSSTAGKFASAFALAHKIYQWDSAFKNLARPDGYLDKAISAYLFGLKKRGYTQTASVKSPYIYAEENWSDDMELAAATLNEFFVDGHQLHISEYFHAACDFSNIEKITPWIGKDTARHYQWYPFINIGHYELAKHFKKIENIVNQAKKKDGEKKSLSNPFLHYYREGIQLVWNKASRNAFYRGVPFIWCSNNLTTSFAIQCYWYRELTGDKTFAELEQANFDWIFGCNPWGTSMVYGLPSWGDTPVDPHSAFTHLKNYPIDGGLVDGPVDGNIYKNLIGIELKDPDEYAEFQSDLVVYHDDYGDYSTNEPTMDGTASLIYLLAAKEAETTSPLPSPKERASEELLNNKLLESGKAPSTGGGWGRPHGAIIRGDNTEKKLALVFTGHEFADGANEIIQSLKKEKTKASFFFTGEFYRNNLFKKFVQQLRKDGHYLGAHSDKHLLYCDWNNRDSLLISNEEFTKDLMDNYNEMDRAGIKKEKALFFLPPYEWYNDTIAAWTKALGLQLINFTPGTKSNADYTTPEMRNYRSSEDIYRSIVNYELEKPAGLNGFILLLHIGTDPKRTDKFYNRLAGLIKYLKAKGYQFQTVDQLLKLD